MVGIGALCADNVGCLEAFRPLQQIELNRFALVQRAVTVLLDGGEMDKNIFAGGALDKTISLSPVEPLYCCLLYTSPSPRDRQKSRMPSSA